MHAPTIASDRLQRSRSVPTSGVKTSIGTCMKRFSLRSSVLEPGANRPTSETNENCFSRSADMARNWTPPNSPNDVLWLPIVTLQLAGIVQSLRRPSYMALL
jgi:hypothetical protein